MWQSGMPAWHPLPVAALGRTSNTHHCCRKYGPFLIIFSFRLHSITCPRTKVYPSCNTQLADIRYFPMFWHPGIISPPNHSPALFKYQTHRSVRDSGMLDQDIHVRFRKISCHVQIFFQNATNSLTTASYSQ